jgi:hypothetical protein
VWVVERFWRNRGKEKEELEKPGCLKRKVSHLKYPAAFCSFISIMVSGFDGISVLPQEGGKG